MDDNSTSPIGLYLASYLIVFTEMNERENDDSGKKFIVCEDTVLVEGENPEDAYHKVLNGARRTDFGQRDCAGRWLCERVTEFLPIYEVFPQGCEIMYRESNSSKLKYLSFPLPSDKLIGFYPH